MPTAISRVRRAPFARTKLVAGTGRIAGDAPGGVTVDGVPARKDVVLMHRWSKLVVGWKQSDAAGRFEFTALNPAEEFTVCAYDRSNVNNAVIADRIVPVVD